MDRKSQKRIEQGIEGIAKGIKDVKEGMEYLEKEVKAIQWDMHMDLLWKSLKRAQEAMETEQKGLQDLGKAAKAFVEMDDHLGGTRAGKE